MLQPILMLTLFLAPPAFTETHHGKVSTVKAGDFVMVQTDQSLLMVRLEGIDCPELTQDYGQDAKKLTAELCLNKKVTVNVVSKDRYGRLLARVVLPDGKELQQVLLKRGAAWWFRRYSRDQDLGKLEAEAQAAKLGLFAAVQRLPPWQFRATQSRLEITTGLLKLQPNGISIAALLPDPEGDDQGKEQITIANATNTDVDLRGWMLIDKIGNVYGLREKVKRHGQVVVTMKRSTMPLDNGNEEVELIDREGALRSQVKYQKSQVKSGQVISFARPPTKKK